MRHSKLFLGLLSLLVIVSCKSKKSRFNGFEKVIHIDKIKEIQTSSNATPVTIHFPATDSMQFDYEKAVKDVKYIKLQTSTKSKFGNIDYLFLDGDRIIVVDLRITQGVFIFDSSGHFINRIGVETSKKNSYDFVDAAFDFKEKQIILHNDAKDLSYYFDIDGKFLKSEPNYIAFHRFKGINGTNDFVFLDPYSHNTHIPQMLKSNLFINPRSSTISYTAPHAIQRTKISDLYTYNNGLSSINSKGFLFYTPVFSDTIYQVNGGVVDVFPKFVLSFPDTDLNSEIRKDTSIGVKRLNKMLGSQEYRYFLGEVSGNNDSVLFFQTYKKGMDGYFYSERTGKFLAGKPISRLIFGDTSRINSFIWPITTYNNYFVSIHKAEEIKSFIGPNPSADLRNTMNATKPGDNPILMLYLLNNF